MQQPNIQIKSCIIIFQIKYNGNQSIQTRSKSKAAKKSQETENPSFPYLDIARKRDSDTQQLSTTTLRVDSGAENGEIEEHKVITTIFVGSKNQLGRGEDELRELTWNRGIEKID